MSDHIFEMVLFSMLGTLMFCSKIIMESLPNIHLLGMFTMLCTVVFRVKGLIPIYLYVIIQGIYAGFAPWWIPYLYIWTTLWGMTMLLPKKMSRRTASVVYPIVCSLHGFAFGTIYAPGQALLYGLNFKQTLLWIAAGLSFDITMGISNIFAGMLVLPLSELLRKLLRRSGRNIC